jgi:excisionase family DNA binding protein
LDKKEQGRIAFRPLEAAAVLGVSPDYFKAVIDPQLKWVRPGGRLRLVSLAELEKWMSRNERLTVSA